MAVRPPKKSKVPAWMRERGPTPEKAAQRRRVAVIQRDARNDQGRGKGGAVQMRVKTTTTDSAIGSRSRTKVSLKKNRFGFSTPGLGTLPKATRSGAEKPKRPPVVAAAQRAVSTSPAVGVATSTTSTKTPATGRKSPGAANSKKERGPKRVRNTASRKEPNSAAMGVEEDDPITGLYAAARRDIDRRQQVADATRLARLEDQKKFDEWVAQQRGASNQSMQDAFARSAADAQAARQLSYDKVSQLANEAIRQSNGIADMLKQAGTDANLGAYGFRTAADAENSSMGAFNTAAQAERFNSQSEADRARAANMVSAYNAQNMRAQEALNQERSQLGLDEIKTRMEQRAADRQYRLDQQAAQFLQGLQEGELQVKQFEAETDRLKVSLTAKQQAEANRIRSAIADGQLTLREAELQLKRKGYQLEKRKQILAEAKERNGGGEADKIRRESVEFLNKWNNDNLAQQGLAAAPRGDAGIAYARSAVQALKAFNRGMTSQAALRTLASVLPGDVLRDNRILQAIDASFR